MSPTPPSNVDFRNLQQHLRELKAALEEEEQASGADKGVRGSAPAVTSEVAEARVQKDLDAIAQSPLHKAKAPGYGGLPIDAIQPLRHLRAALLRAKEAGEETESDASAEVEERLRALVFSINPSHPFLTRHEKGDMAEQKGQATPQMQEAEKAIGKQPAKDEAAVELSGLAPERGEATLGGSVVKDEGDAGNEDDAPNEGDGKNVDNGGGALS
ncbi:hypothetical protein KC343_g6577 [Hortaea werneckii]|nr:hypothetical protein KC323_g2473 [Hortaea werneckii]KAI7189807.1 hypothetical protein KC352_g21847 [Hortaea werneckii]KAI7615780.1 hypothetical protein KC346_g6307 [Hortaea werneckii]KAI7625661.1 hypothetical protein KC343_g6577 [Hortaea werneckii]KAI7667615.1 hypothetical protein KC319_g6621 [Hortaea werneckii]